jgi:hypothetical protein
MPKMQFDEVLRRDGQFKTAAFAAGDQLLVPKKAEGKFPRNT